MRQIRFNTFETNSSSSHSLVITNRTDNWLTPEECIEDLWISFDRKTGIYEPYDSDDNMQFNRYPFKILDTFESKLLFLYANVIPRITGKTKNGWNKYTYDYYKITNIVNKFIPEFKKVKFPKDTKPSCEAHNVLATIKQYITFEEFLRNPNIIVICDGDEYRVWDRMKEYKLINTSEIVKEVEFQGG